MISSAKTMYASVLCLRSEGSPERTSRLFYCPKANMTVAPLLLMHVAIMPESSNFIKRLVGRLSDSPSSYYMNCRTHTHGTCHPFAFTQYLYQQGSIGASMEENPTSKQTKRIENRMEVKSLEDLRKPRAPSGVPSPKICATTTGTPW